ncbi:MAG TPA: EAL domain-containing protein [Burkholderiaceae bacterium]|nr:EAL domain-containing protein [Burkholderiaceae bacterium]
MGVALSALTAEALRRAEHNQRALQLSSVADGFGALLQMHLAGCEEALRAASMVVSADPSLGNAQWQAIGRQVRVGEFNACAESMIYLDAGRARPPAASTGMSSSFARRSLLTPPPAASAPGQTAPPFDPWQDPAHRAAMEAARDQGQPRLTERVTWPGIDAAVHVVVWYMPVFLRDAAADSPEQRAEALIGYVGIPIRVQGVADVLAQQFPDARLQLECHAGASDMLNLPTDSSAGVATADARERTLRVGGRWWTLRAGLDTPQAGLLERVRPSALALAAGLALSALSAWLAWQLLTQSVRSHALAQRYSRESLEREARLRSVLDGARDAIFTLDVAGRVLGANHAVQEILGHSEAELLGREASLLLPPEHLALRRDQWLAFLQQARQRADGHGPTCELALQHRDGQRLHARSSLSLVRTEAGEFVVWMLGDVTHEREMERQAQQTAALNQAIMDAAPIGVMTIAASGLITSANQAAHVMHGYEPGELPGRPASRLLELQEEASPTGHGAEIECTALRKDGSRFAAGVVALPLRDAAGQALGGLRIVTDITERKRAAAKIEHIALHDSLTGLPNRLLLQDRAEQALSRARRQSECCALVLLDLDRFKQINDTLGHSVGDQVLKIAAQRLTGTVRESDTVARMGGDEFALVLPDMRSGEQAAEVARKMLAALADELAIEGYRLHVTASVGVALYPAHGTGLETLLRNADAAMYDAKARGRDAVSVYDERMSEQASDQLALQADLRQALARNQLVLHYQPLVDPVTGKVHALEALLRWQHPERGLVPPVEFIPLAEDTGLIVPIGGWVLRQACMHLAHLRMQGRPGLRMAVNLSPRQFKAEGLEADVRGALDNAGLPGEALELEITESVLMNSVERTQRILAALRTMGVRIAIDDFGTGYSSLSYLANFPVQTVKVDRSFVRQIDSGEGTALLAGAIVAMAHRLGIEVVAEGVETLDQHSHLLDLGCELLQGFRFSKPVPFEQLAEVMARVEGMARLDPDLRVEIWSDHVVAA